MMVKICGITNGKDAVVAAEAGAAALGFNFYPKSPRYVTPERATEIARDVPAGVLRVGVFVNERAGAIRDIMQRVPLDVAQLHGECEAPAGARVWRALAVGEDFDPAEIALHAAEAFLLDAPAGERYGGTGQTFDWERVKDLAGRIILAGGLGAGNVAEAIRAVRPWGVDACSRLESEPGRKDPAKVREFLREALGVKL